jgi:hypothetical protein
MESSMNLPGVFILDAQERLDACMDLIPVTSSLRYPVASQLLLQIVMHLLLDSQEQPVWSGLLDTSVGAVTVDQNESNAQRLCTTVNTFASQDISQYKYAFTEEIMLNLYQWYFETYMLVLAELNHYFPKFQQLPSGLPYTVKLYDTLLRFDHTPHSRNYAYVMDRTI